jgi:hypothetical protein
MTNTKREASKCIALQCNNQIKLDGKTNDK